MDTPQSEPAEVMPVTDDDQTLVDALRRGDEQAFVTLVDRYHPALVRLAMTFVGDRAVAEDIAQETWLGVLRGIGNFEGRSSLKTWLFHILVNRAKTRAQREGRTIPFSDLANQSEEDGDIGINLDRFFPADDPQRSGYWSAPPHSWETVPEERILSLETREQIAAAIDMLPPNQRTVITLRDVEGWSSEEVCDFLNISEANQRVLLHRARGKVRSALEGYLEKV